MQEEGSRLSQAPLLFLRVEHKRPGVVFVVAPGRAQAPGPTRPPAPGHDTPGCGSPTPPPNVATRAFTKGGLSFSRPVRLAAPGLCGEQRVFL